jgi:hypothetical protein
MGNPNPRPGPGRPKGSKNRRTLALIARERITGEVPSRNMTEPEALLFKMRWWLSRFAGEERKPDPDLAFMERCLDKAQEAAVASAPYHHARLSAVTVGASTVTEIKITGGMSRRDFPELPADLAPGTVIEADENGLNPDDVDAGPSPAAA